MLCRSQVQEEQLLTQLAFKERILRLAAMSCKLEKVLRGHTSSKRDDDAVSRDESALGALAEDEGEYLCLKPVADGLARQNVFRVGRASWFVSCRHNDTHACLHTGR